MRQRSISAVGVVFVGLVPAFIGGPVIFVVFTLLCLVGLAEYQRLAKRVGRQPRPVGYLIVTAFGVAALANGRELAIIAIVFAAIALAFVEVIGRSDLESTFLDWSLATAGALYLGIPAFAAIALRQTPGSVDADWLSDLAGSLAIGWEAHPRGLAWLLLAILVTWLCDTGAYLIGRAIGKRPLIPTVSPKKTVEGLAGGLICAAATGALVVWWFGLDVHPLVGAVIGLIVGAVGVIGDLAESLLKRQAGVKDSGTLIPGHGGMLDRIDALLFTLPVGWLIASSTDRWIL